MRIFKAIAVAVALLGLCVLLSAKDVWGFNSPLGDDLNIDTFTLALAGVAQATLAYFVYRQIAAEDSREQTRLAHAKAMVIADFLAACTNANALYAQVAHHAEVYVEDLDDPEKQKALQRKIDAIEPARQVAHAQKVRLFAWADGDLKSSALELILRIDAQRRKAVQCVSWKERVQAPRSALPDPGSIRGLLPEAAVKNLEQAAGEALGG